MFICCILGKILEDSKVINDYKIEEKNFVVVMVTKVRDWTVSELLWSNKCVEVTKWLKTVLCDNSHTPSVVALSLLGDPIFHTQTQGSVWLML